MFANAYEGGTVKTSATKETASVFATSDVVAPGTGGSFTITLDGTAEVRAAININLTGSPVSYSGGGESYEPIKWSVGEKTGLTFAGLQGEISSFNSSNSSINPGTSIKEKSLTISWAWDFNDNNDEVSKKDTLLGRMAAAGTDATTYKENGIDYTMDLIMDVSVAVTISQLQTTPTV